MTVAPYENSRALWPAFARQLLAVAISSRHQGHMALPRRVCAYYSCGAAAKRAAARARRETFSFSKTLLR